MKKLSTLIALASDIVVAANATESTVIYRCVIRNQLSEIDSTLSFRKAAWAVTDKLLNKFIEGFGVASYKMLVDEERFLKDTLYRLDCIDMFSDIGNVDTSWPAVCSVMEGNDLDGYLEDIKESSRDVILNKIRSVGRDVSLMEDDILHYYRNALINLGVDDIDEAVIEFHGAVVKGCQRLRTPWAAN